jgi:hypothetical protein
VSRQTIAELRAELAQLLDVPAFGAKVERTVPEQIAPPAAILQPADPFVFETQPGPDSGNTFAEPFVIGFEVVLLVPLDETHDNEQASGQLDQLLDQLLDLITPSEWWLERIEQPRGQLTTDWIAHGQRVTVQRRITL